MKGKPYVDRVRGRFTTQESFSRNIDPYYRRFQKNMYGGREWMNIILALGTIDETIVAKMNEIVQQRSEAADPLLQRRDHMLPKAERAPRTVQGVDHHISEGKKLRMQAKAIDRRIQAANKDWERTATCLIAMHPVFVQDPSRLAALLVTNRLLPLPVLPKALSSHWRLYAISVWPVSLSGHL